jgi:hypothetical protein
MPYSMQIQELKMNKVIIITLTGIIIIITSVIFYPYSLPTIITSENSRWIDIMGYIFYALLFASMILIAFGIRKMFRIWDRVNTSSSSSSSSMPPSSHSLSKIIISIVNNKKHFRFFWPSCICYGFFYSVVSGMLIYRPDNISSVYGVSIPSVVITSYGPVAYVPTVACYFTEHIGLLLIPINLIVTAVVSALVGFNSVLSVYAFVNRPKKKSSPSTTVSNSSSSIIGLVGAATGLFTACPTCASFYFFSVMAGSLAPTVAAFAVNYYVLFVLVSIPLLLVTPLITALGIRRMMFGHCSLDK